MTDNLFNVQVTSLPLECLPNGKLVLLSRVKLNIDQSCLPCSINSQTQTSLEPLKRLLLAFSMPKIKHQECTVFSSCKGGQGIL